MGILVNRAALEAYKHAPQSDLPIRYAAGPGSLQADHYCETAHDLIGLFMQANISRSRAARVVWAGSPMPPPAVASDVQNAVRTYFNALGMATAHRGPAAVAVSQALGAQAFAVGNDPVFGAGPSSGLMAHEATHVIQQGSGKP